MLYIYMIYRYIYIYIPMISHDDWLVSHLQSTFSPGELAHHPPSHSRQVTARRQVAALETRGGTTSEIYSGRWDISDVFHWDSYEILIGYPNFIHISRKQPSEYLLDIPISFIYPEIQKTTLRISIGYPKFIHISRKQPSEYLLDIPISFIYPENNPQNIYWISQFHSYIQKTTLRISIGYPNFIHISRKQPSEYLLDIPISFIYPENNPQNIYWISQFHSYIQKTTLRISIGYPNFIHISRKQPSEYLLDIPISLIAPENNPQNIYWISQFHS